MYHAIVIDDEKWVVKSLIATIKNQDYFEITEEFYDGLSTDVWDCTKGTTRVF